MSQTTEGIAKSRNSTGTGALDDGDASGQFAVEHKRIDIRRTLLEQPTDDTVELKNFGLALSGGGIRSATFALGVMQAMARAPSPASNHGSMLPPEPTEPQPDAMPASSASHAKPQRAPSLLQRFDYLSTVSGGGYIGSFFIALFIPDRKRPGGANGDPVLHRQDALDAYKAFEVEPPGKIHVRSNYQTRNGRGEAAMAWLRENGRYLLAAGAGDYFYALALSVRNLVSVHFVLGMPIIAALALLEMLKTIVDPRLGEAFPSAASTLLCDTLWWLPIAWMLLAVVPAIIAFWMVYSLKSENDAVKLLNLCSGSMLAILVAFVVIGYFLLPQVSFGFLCLLGAGELLLALFVFYEIQSGMRHPSQAQDELGNGVRRYRVEVTRRLSQDMVILTALAFLAAVEHLTGAVYDWLANPQWKALTALLGPALIALVRWCVRMLDEKDKPAWLAKLPVNVVAGAVGFTILLFVAVLWGLLVQWMANAVTTPEQRYAALAAMALVGIGLTISSGFFIGFINLSSLHAFYSSRLARTYLGASNQSRFTFFADEQKRRALLSVTEAIPDDDMPLEIYYSSAAAPVHLINVTMNLTTDPAEQLVQRDRKGKPLCVAPGSAPNPGTSDSACDASLNPVTFMLDGQHYSRDPKAMVLSEIDQPLNVSHWIATSGAALTTGLGRATSLGTSLALGLANIRLGTWWPSRFVLRASPASTGAIATARPAPAADPSAEAPSRREDSERVAWYKAKLGALRSGLFKTQTYLVYELTAHFHGLRREYQYLSDGGHFENTAAYELLREGRKIELIVVCDSGSDPDYSFQDLTNLIRLARIDQRLEIKLDSQILSHPTLAPYFGRLEDFGTCAVSSKQRCAVLLNVFRLPAAGERSIDEAEAVPDCRILLIKPRVIKGLAADAWNYAQAHPQFPNESTADQFFDEAQFESYRQLGLTQGRLLFGEGGKHTAVSQALWSYLKLV
jgi:hypothetical protein